MIDVGWNRYRYTAKPSGKYFTARSGRGSPFDSLNLMGDILAPYFAFLHHLAAFTIFASLVIEFVLIKEELTLKSARKLQRADLAYGIAAGIVIIVGFLRVFYFEKGPNYYFHSAPFSMKMAAFIIVGLLSVFPTVEFLSWSKSLKVGQLPAVSARKIRTVRMLINLELVGIAVVILGAALMAKGVGYGG